MPNLTQKLAAGLKPPRDDIHSMMVRAAKHHAEKTKLQATAASEIARMSQPTRPSDDLRKYLADLASGNKADAAEQLQQQLHALDEEDLWDIFDAAKALHDLDNLLSRADEHGDDVRRILRSNGIGAIRQLFDAICLEGCVRVALAETHGPQPCRTLCEIAATHYTRNDDLAEAARIMGLCA